MIKQICVRCVLDSEDDPFITFDEEGICSMCHLYEREALKRVLPQVEKVKAFNNLISKIKSHSGKKYDCIIGVSGGVDSTYVAFKVKEAGLNPLAVHLDNGWNSELAVKNIESIVNKLGIDLYTYVIDWSEFKDLQLSFIRASVVDIELLTDHAINAILYKMATKYGIKYILSGENFTTEGILPPSWVFQKNDLINIKSIHSKYGTRKMKTFPELGYFKMIFLKKMYNIETVYFLDLIEYNKISVKKIIQDELGWRDYGGKHYESIFTRFYQSYILPRKFNIDKRKSHYSTLICAGQLSRENALQLLEEPICDFSLLKEDKQYVIKKLGISEAEFDQLMTESPRAHTDFKSVRGLLESPLLRRTSTLIKKLKKSKIN